MAKTNPKRRHPKFIDLTGQQFGKWTVIGEAEGIGRKAHWNCICHCGNRNIVCGTVLRRGKSKCCLQCRNASHRKSNTPEYKAWQSMKARCQNPSDKRYKNYGGRGISICPEWESFETFFADMGQRPSSKHSIDRIDNSKGYSPDNCRWTTQAKQLRNTRRTRLITFQGETRCIADWAEILGIHRNTITGRLRRGWSVENALTSKD
jgi:hypothetical protein